MQDSSRKGREDRAVPSLISQNGELRNTVEGRDLILTQVRKKTGRKEWETPQWLKKEMRVK